MMESVPELRTFPRSRAALLIAAALAASLVVVLPPVHPSRDVSEAGGRAWAIEGYGDLPISFEPNVGQAPGRYDFVARGQGFGMAISAKGATLALGTTAQDLLRLSFPGANGSADPRALESLPGTVNYFIGNDPSEWRSAVPTFGRVSYAEVLPGIDVTYYGTNAGTLEYDLEVAPGTDPGDIRLEFSGASGLTLQGGSLLITTGNGTVTQEAPALYQMIAGRRVPVGGGFSLEGDEVGFEVGAYDHRFALVIDPTLIYSTYLGGLSAEEGRAIAVDGSGQAFVVGSTNSTTTFPTTPTPPGPAPYQSVNNGGSDVFVSMLNSSGSALIYSTYLGGSGNDAGGGIAVDGSGQAYATGSTSSTDFPTTPGAFQPQNAGHSDAFVTKLDAAGSALVYSTYLGGPSNSSGPGNDIGLGIAVTGGGLAYVTGSTTSKSFPTTPAAYQVLGAGGADAFLTKVDLAGQSLIFSTYLGGSGTDSGAGVAIGGTPVKAFVAGVTSSTDFPTVGPYQPQHAGGTDDAFVTQFHDTGQSLKFSTYLGGSSDDSGRGIAVDGIGRMYVAGLTNSLTTFPTTLPPGPTPYQAVSAGGTDAFVTKLDYATGLIYSTYLGGQSDDWANGIALDGSGQAHVTGYTYSANFPTTPAPIQGSNAGPADAFVTKLDLTFHALVFSTYLGGLLFDSAQGIAVDAMGAVYVVGTTGSTNFHTQAPFQASSAGPPDAFVAKLTEPPNLCDDHPITIQATGPGLTTGTPGPDVINGTPGFDIIDGLGGNDRICGLGEADELYGGTGNDRLFGNNSYDTIHGGAGNDTVYGGAIKDYLYGEKGDDDLYGGDGNDQIFGNDGDDNLYGGPHNDDCDGGAPNPPQPASPPPGDTGWSCNTSVDIP